MAPLLLQVWSQLADVGASLAGRVLIVAAVGACTACKAACKWQTIPVAARHFWLKTSKQ